MSEPSFKEITYPLRTGFGVEITVKSLIPGKPNGAAVVLAHGMANDLDYPLLIRTTEEAAARGFTAVRFNFPYREAGKDQADSAEKLIDSFTGVCGDTLSRYGIREDRLFAGGKSLGARVAAMSVAGGLNVVGLVFLGFPLQPPGRPDKSRADMIEAVSQVPQIFFAGTRDPFCPLADLKSVLGKLPTARLEIIEGGDHSFVPLKYSEKTLEEITDDIARTAAEWLQELAGAST